MQQIARCILFCYVMLKEILDSCFKDFFEIYTNFFDKSKIITYICDF